MIRRELFKLSLLGLTILFFTGCGKDGPPNSSDDPSAQKESQGPLLELLDPSKTGVDFVNSMQETPEVNVFTHEAFIQGAGVALLDVNNDGLMDVYFAGNQTSDKLYLNKGDLKFEDITGTSGIVDDLWSTGVSVVDINGDGYDDVYVCKFFYDDPLKRVNRFFINNGDNTFTDRASQYGVADNGHSIMANFFDYDNDGDLDLYVANQPPNNRALKDQFSEEQKRFFTDRLYRNDGNKFTNVTDEAGVSGFNYSLSVVTFDYDKDGYTDIYVASDYAEPDLFYKNMGNGKFVNAAQYALKHMSNFSMGVDVSDINNDSYLDIYVADMAAEDNYNSKTSMSGMDPKSFWGLVSIGYHYQYMFNALQLNNGNGSFSEIAQMANVDKTDWSWAPLFVDLDQDRYVDLLVTNGIIKELRNKDFEIWMKDYIKDQKAQAKQAGLKSPAIDAMMIANKPPSRKVSNYLFRNNGDLTFDKVMEEWGLDQPGWSNGAAYGDLDNDGDMDLVINNTNLPASIYKNRANETRRNNWLKVRLEGPEGNPHGYNATVELRYNNEEVQYGELTPYRGYMSSCEPMVHFGLGNVEMVPEVIVRWPGGASSRLQNVEANREIEIKYAEAGPKIPYPSPERLNIQVIQLPGEGIAHEENDFDDYEREVLLPYKLSTMGPAAAVGDFNRDGNEDFFIGGSAGNPGRLMANTGGNFVPSNEALFNRDRTHEDAVARFVDIDMDGDLDLFVGSGSNEDEPGSNYYQDRLYVNNGSGDFTPISLPKINISTGAVAFLDYDGDNDLDIFVGGRQIPGQYGHPASSLILEQTSPLKFKDVTDAVAPIFKEFGMVTSAEVADLDGNGTVELVIAGEWMPIRVFNFNEGKIVENTENFGLENSNGLWNKIELKDVNGDGSLDIVAGNMGLNIKHKASEEAPFTLYADDFDGNGTHDVYLGYYDEDGKLYPVRGRSCSSDQMPFVKEKFASYTEFGTATVEDVLAGKIKENSVITKANTLANTIFYNRGANGFESANMPMEAQISPIYGMAFYDVNKDGREDIIAVGNLHDREVETTRSDAGTGVILINQGNEQWKPLRTNESAIYADGNARHSLLMKTAGGQVVLGIVNNNGPVQFYLLP